MSSGGAAAAAAAARVSAVIPQGVRKTIQNIKEIAGGHTDEEVYAMLRDCNMDPNETAQKLLLQDTFHEVKRKRDKKKEGNKEPADSRWRPGMQGRGGKGGRGNYSSRHLSNSNDLGGRNVISGKENGVNPNTDKGSSSSPINPNTDTKTSTSISSSSGGLSNGPSQPVAPVAVEESSLSVGDMPKSISKVSVDLKGSFPSEEVVTALGPDVAQSSKAPPSSVSGSCTSALDPVLVPSLDSHTLGEVGATERAIGSQWTVGEYKVVSRDVSVNARDTSQPSGSSSIGRPSGSRPSSSYSSGSQQLSGSQKVVPNKEWKPKSTNTAPAQATETVSISDGVPMTAETVRQSLPESNSVNKEDPSLKVDKKFNDLRLSDRQHVIIPNHLQVPESEKYGLSFGSFDTSFEQTMGSSKDPESEKSATPPEYESSQELDETVDEPISSDQNASSTVQEAAESGPQQLSTEMPENFSPAEVENSSSTPEIAEPDQPKDASVASEVPQYSVVQTAPPYSTFGLAPQLLGDQIPALETSEPQARDATRTPNLVVQQPIDLSTSYYAQLYRPTADVDGRFSPFLAHGAAIKYGNISVLPAQTGQAQEGSNSLVLSSSGSTPLATPAAGVVQSSIAIPQQPVPLFRQPVGVHLPHYPPNYIPYNQYISPFYLPPPTLHHFLSNAAFPQQPSTGGMYPSPGSAAVAPPVKYSVPPYKPSANTGNPTHVGIPGAYGTYGSSPSGYTSNTAVASGNSAESDDVSASQFKENNIYIAGQQSEGSAVWIPAPGRDISSLQASSFYGLHPQGQQMTFAPAQAGHGAFGGIYHPTQTLPGAAVHPLLQPSQTLAGAVEMVGPPANVYQQQQRAQMNWANNY